MRRIVASLLLLAALCCAHVSRAGWLPLVKTVAGGTVAVDVRSATFIPTTSGNVTTLTLPLTIGASANAVEVLINWATTAPPAGITATWNSVSMTVIPSTTSGTNGGCTCSTAAYGILAPTTGTHNVVVSWTGATEGHAVALSFTGVNQGSIAAAFPNGTQVIKNTSTASPITATITSGTGHVVVAMASEQSSAYGTINGTQIATSDPSTGPSLAVAANFNTGAATVSPSFAFTGPGVWSIVANDVSP